MPRARTGWSVDRRRTLVTAVGGARQVPAPDPIAQEYLLLGLRLDQRIPGLVDEYFGPAELKARVDTDQLRAPARLREEAVLLAERVGREVDDAARREWLTAQLRALETHAAVLAGDPLAYHELVTRSMGFMPARRDDVVFRDPLAAIDALLPGDGSVNERLAAWDRGPEIPVDRLPAVVDWLVARFRDRAARLFGLPEGEDLRVSLVTGQPWSGYNWFDGGRRSRVDLNTDLPVRAPDLVHTVAHETYPGHHLEHAWKEADLVDRLGRLEASILLINTPECPISEGLADLGASFAAPSVELADLLAYLQDVGGYAPDLAAKRLEFIEHPLWRTYVFVYDEGETLLRRWMEAVPAPEWVARFGRLLHEQVTPGRLLAELG